jgi:hypothetical protein
MAIYLVISNHYPKIRVAARGPINTTNLLLAKQTKEAFSLSTVSPIAVGSGIASYWLGISFFLYF